MVHIDYSACVKMIDFAKYKHKLIALVKNSVGLDPLASDDATRYGYIYIVFKREY